MNISIIFRKYIIVFIVILLVIIFGSWFFNQNDFFSKKIDSEINYVKIGGQIVKVELAETPEAQMRGLSGRKGLEIDEGMLFIFSEPKINYFWMKEMKFSIDILWIDESFQIIFLEKMVSPESYPNSFGPNQKSKYVLEVYAGFSEKNNLKENDQIEFMP